MARKNQQFVLLGLLMAALAVLLYRNVPWPAGLTGAGTAAAKASPAGPAGGPVPDVGLDRLQAGQPGIGEVGRNPFKMQPKAAAPAPDVTPTPPPTAEPPVVDGRPPEAPAGPPPRPPIPLKFIGVVNRGGGSERLAVLSDGTLVFYGREREIIDGRYRIVKIGEESIEIEYADGRGRQTIRLTGGS